jgi:predicted regulator of Ras-like GTPase activity (Roadblock/LC7/MglB family)
LLVGAKLPAELEGERVAAFLPQALSRMEQVAQALNSRVGDGVLVSMGAFRVHLSRRGELVLMVLGARDLPFAEEQVEAMRLNLK